MEIMRDVEVKAESSVVVPDQVAFTQEIADMVQHNAVVANIQTVGLVAVVSLLSDKFGISFADFTNRAEKVQNILNTEAGSSASMLELVMMACEKPKIEKAE